MVSLPCIPDSSAPQRNFPPHDCLRWEDNPACTNISSVGHLNVGLGEGEGDLWSSLSSDAIDVKDSLDVADLIHDGPQLLDVGDLDGQTDRGDAVVARLGGHC